MIKWLLFAKMLGAASALHCNEHNALQWSCYTVSNEPDEPRTLAGLATKLHVNPHRFAELNSLGEYDIRTWQVDAGAALRVPHYAACIPRDGAWACYEVQEDGESLAALASSAKAPWRSAAGLAAARAMNARALFNESDTLFAGMHVRLPIAQCQLLGDAAQSYHRCVAAQRYDTLDDFAKRHGTTAAGLLALNDDVLSGDPALVEGMVLAVPRAQPLPPPAGCDPTATPDDAWFCYTVASGDTVATIASAHGAHPQRLCEWNKLANCSEIDVGQTLAVPGLISLACTSVPGQFACWKMDGVYDGSPDSRLPFPLWDLYFVGDSGVMDTVKGLNSWAVPDLMVWPGMTVLLPLRRCMPSAKLECVTREEYDAAVYPPDGRGFYNQMSIREIGDK